MVNELMKMVEDRFSNQKSFWQIFLGVVDRNEFMGSGASEYEIYFTFMNLYHPNDIVIRQLNWDNKDRFDNNNNYDFISIHWYMRK
jgi:hypothetical protein